MAPVEEPSAAVARRRLSLEQGVGVRRVPDAGQIARRRRVLRWTKWVLPAGALLLLASIAAWPELQRQMNSARLGLREATQVRVDSGRMLGARYRGLDGRDRPYMITADEAQQVAPPQPEPVPQQAGTQQGAGTRQGMQQGTQPAGGPAGTRAAAAAARSPTAWARTAPGSVSVPTMGSTCSAASFSISIGTPPSTATTAS